MYSTFNTASLAKLSKSELYALLAKYWAKLDHSGESESPAIQSVIARIKHALAQPSGP